MTSMRLVMNLPIQEAMQEARKKRSVKPGDEETVQEKAAGCEKPNRRESEYSRAMEVHLTKDGEIELFLPYNQNDISAIRNIEGSKWEQSKRCWVLPSTQECALLLHRAFGRRIRWSDEAVLEPVRRAIRLRGYSPRTREGVCEGVSQFAPICPIS